MGMWSWNHSGSIGLLQWNTMWLVAVRTVKDPSGLKSSWLQEPGIYTGRILSFPISNPPLPAACWALICCTMLRLIWLYRYCLSKLLLVLQERGRYDAVHPPPPRVPGFHGEAQADKYSRGYWQELFGGCWCLTVQLLVSTRCTGNILNFICVRLPGSLLQRVCIYSVYLWQIKMHATCNFKNWMQKKRTGTAKLCSSAQQMISLPKYTKTTETLDTHYLWCNNTEYVEFQYFAIELILNKTFIWLWRLHDLLIFIFPFTCHRAQSDYDSLHYVH